MAGRVSLQRLLAATALTILYGGACSPLARCCRISHGLSRILLKVAPEAAISCQHRTRHVARCVGCEQNEWPVEFLELCKALERDGPDGGLAVGLLQELLHHRGEHAPRCERVDADAVRRQFGGEAACQMIAGRLGAAVGSQVLLGAVRVGRRDGDDTAADAAANHVPGDRLGDEPGLWEGIAIVA